jgi:hypothetical protein
MESELRFKRMMLPRQRRRERSYSSAVRGAIWLWKLIGMRRAKTESNPLVNWRDWVWTAIPVKD